MKAIELCLNRFDGDTKTAFLDLYTKVDIDAVKPTVVDEAQPSDTLAPVEGQDESYF